MPLTNSPRAVSILKLTAYFLLGAAIFALAYGQAPLYFSNQNQYFVHGLAAGGFGYLDQDWLANTTDPTPVFSFLVAVTYRFFTEEFFYVYYALLMGVYFASLVGLFNVLAGERASPAARIVFIALLLLVHSALVRFASARLLGVDYPWYLQAGVAGQYVLGPMLQPSVFGVLLLASLYFFLKGKPLLAVTCSSLGAVCHATYLLPAAMLTISYMTVLAFEKQIWKSLLAGLWALVVVLPVVIYNFVSFRPTSPELFAEAQEILVHFRIPHHAIPRLWFDEIAALQVGWLLLGILLSRGSRLYPVLLLTFLLSMLLSIAQVITGNDTLALLFPWRVSVILIPVATAVILTRLLCVLSASARKFISRRGAENAEKKLLWAGSVVLIAGLVVSGVVIVYYGLAFQQRDEELALMDHVREHKSSGDVYLLPVPIPNLKDTVRGSFKSDFKPLAKLQEDDRFIPVNLQRFRLQTGAPIFVDFKSIPYRDVDVLQWRQRLDLNQRFYNELKAGRTDWALPELHRHGITHIVMPAHEVMLDAFPVVYEDRYYRVYRPEG